MKLIKILNFSTIVKNPEDIEKIKDIRIKLHSKIPKGTHFYEVDYLRFL